MTGKRKAPPGSKPAQDNEPAREATPPVETTALEIALRASVPGIVIADGDLELAGGATIDLACVDESGRGLFVRAVDGQSAETVLEALDLVRGVRENQDVLFRHLAVPGLREDLPPLAVLVAERFSEEVLARLTCVQAGALWCLERRSIRSRASASEHLVPVLAHAAPVAERPADPTEFCQHLAPEHRDLGLDLVGRLARIDDDLEHVGVDRGVCWNLGGEQVCSLFARDGRLEGIVAPRTVPSDIDSMELIDSFVEEALGRAVQLIGAPLGLGGIEGLGGAEGDEDPVTMLREAALDPSQPILTPEEIQAFRDL